MEAYRAGPRSRLVIWSSSACVCRDCVVLICRSAWHRARERATSGRKTGVGGEDEGLRPRGGEARFIITTIKFNKNRPQCRVGRAIMAVGWKSAFSINKTSSIMRKTLSKIPPSVLLPYNLRQVFLWNVPLPFHLRCV